MIPTDAEIVFWCSALVITVAVMLLLPRLVSTNKVDDVKSWQHNYSKLQNRY